MNQLFQWAVAFGGGLCLCSGGSSNALGYFLRSKTFTNTLAASLLQASLFYSLTSYFHLSMDCLILFVLQRASRITQISLFLHKKKKKKGLFFCHCFFLALFGELIDRFFFFSSYKFHEILFGERTSAWEGLTQPSPPTSTAARVKWHLRKHKYMEDSLPQRSCCLMGALPDKPRLKAPGIFLKRSAIKLCKTPRVPIQASQFFPLAMKGARLKLFEVVQY